MSAQQHLKRGLVSPDEKALQKLTVLLLCGIAREGNAANVPEDMA
jgi:hypothetical protein